MIITVVKTFMFLFPLIKEIILGKEDKPRKRKREQDKLVQKLSLSRTVKLFFVAIGCLSVCINLVLVKQLFAVSSENVMLNRQIKELRELPTIPHSVPTIPTESIPSKEPQVKKPVTVKTKPNRYRPKNRDTDQHQDTVNELKEINKISFHFKKEGNPL